MSAEVVPLKEEPKEPTYKASDIVTEVMLAMDLGAGKMSLRSHVRNLDGLPALRNELDKLTNASDWIRAKYHLRELKLTLEVNEKEIILLRADHANYIMKAQTEWNISQRRGPLQLTQSQQNVSAQQENSIQSRIAAIEKIKKDIAVEEAILKGSE